MRWKVYRPLEENTDRSLVATDMGCLKTIFVLKLLILDMEVKTFIGILPFNYNSKKNKCQELNTNFQVIHSIFRIKKSMQNSKLILPAFSLYHKTEFKT